MNSPYKFTDELRFKKKNEKDRQLGREGELVRKE